MGKKALPFNVTELNVKIEEGFKLRWQGREIELRAFAYHAWSAR